MTGRYSDTTQRSISASSSETTVLTGYTVPAYELQGENTIRVRFFGTWQTLASTTTITWRVKLGGTTILTSTAQQSGSTSQIDFSGDLTIVGTSTTAQKVALAVYGKNTGSGAALTYGLIDTGTGSRDMRLDRALTVTAQFSDGSSMDIEHASYILEQ